MIFSANNLPTCWNLLSKFARFCGVLTSVASPLARALYLARTIFLPAGIFSPNLHAFVVFSPSFRLHLLQLCQMEPKIFPLDAITPETKNWTAKVSILNKTEPRTSSQPASIRFQKLLLADNKIVRPVKPGFENPLTNNKYQWILGARTAILATDEDTLILSKLAPTFTHSDQFRDFLGKRTLISTAAIIIDSHPPRTVMAKGKENTLHEYAAVDELLNPFIITFWNDVAPDDDLQKWGVLYIHKERIDVLQQQGDVFRKAQTNFVHDTETFTSIETLLTTEQPNRYDLLARGKVARTNQNFVYPCCAKCHRLTTAAYGRLFECHSFHEIRNAIPRFRFSLLVYDESGEIEVTVFGNEGEKLMQMSANDFMNQYCNNEPLILDSINSNLHQLKLKMKIQSKVFNKQDGTTTMSHTMQTLECHQLASSASPAGIANVLELSASQKNETTSLQSTTKEHPRSDIHPNTSSHGRASKAKKTE
ncbi:hypothetical protein OROHE_024725 [Orobanche hederae]